MERCPSDRPPDRTGRDGQGRAGKSGKMELRKQSERSHSLSRFSGSEASNNGKIN